MISAGAVQIKTLRRQIYLPRFYRRGQVGLAPARCGYNEATANDGAKTSDIVANNWYSVNVVLGKT